jgi:threonyl-tRNA synthetase
MNYALGRQWQMGTIQLDFQLPQRFDISYVGRDGEEKIPVIVHRVIYGSLERFMGILIEHTGGKFPLWIAPEQVRVLSVSEKYNDYAKEIGNKLKKAGDEYNLWVRSQVDGGDSSLESKIRAGEVMKIPYILVVGGREQKNKSVSVRIRGKGDIGEVDFTEFRKKMIDEIRSKKLGLWK